MIEKEIDELNECDEEVLYKLGKNLLRLHPLLSVFNYLKISKK